MSSDWDEIKRLAGDFQKVQLSPTLQKLSERNCIEIVTLLIEKGLISVVFTNDGKEYITPDHLQREIEDELYGNGGRINLVELSKTLNVDLSKINEIADKLCKQSMIDDDDDSDDVHYEQHPQQRIYCVLGQLLNDEYCERMAHEINEQLLQKGEISVSDLTVKFDLPGDFLLTNIMEKYLAAGIIAGRQDSNDSRIFFTQQYIVRCKGKIRGALAALTRPISVAAILQCIGVPERIFHMVFNELAAAGVCTSKQQGAQYIPYIYTKTQTDWVQSFYKQNGYLEYDSVARLGVSDPKTFVKRQLPNENLQYLEKCCIGSRIIDQVEAAVEECISSDGYLDVSTILPTIMIDADIEQILTIVLNQQKQKNTILFDNTLLTNIFMENLQKPCRDLIDENAKQSVDSGKYQQFIAERQLSGGGGGGAGHKLAYAFMTDTDIKGDRKDERRRKAAGGKAGGGAQGRETRTKSTKKHYRGGGGDRGRNSDSDDEQISTIIVQNKNQSTTATTLELITIKDIEKLIIKPLENEGLEYLSKKIAQYFYPQLTKLAMASAHNLYEASLQNSSTNRRQTHSNLQEKLNNLIVDIRLYEKGLKLLSNDLQAQLVKYLLKTLGTDGCNELFMYVSNECNLNVAGGTTTAAGSDDGGNQHHQLTIEQRLKIAQDCDPVYKQNLLTLNKTLSGSSIDDYLHAIEVAMQSCSMILKKIDKKKDRTIILCHKNGLLEQLSNCNDSALVLHLAILILFTKITQNMLHASGKHVSAILTYLQSSLTDDQWNLLRKYHDLVLKLLNVKQTTTTTPPAVDDDHDENGNNNNDGVKEILSQLEEMMPAVRELANSYKKSSAVNE